MTEKDYQKNDVAHTSQRKFRRGKVLNVFFIIVFMFSLMDLQLLSPVQAEGEYSWVAYNDCAGTTSGNNTNYTVTSGSTTGYLKDFDSGTNVAASVTFSSSEALTVSTTTGAFPNSGTDAYTTFNGYANMVGVISYGASGYYVDMTFEGLDPTKTYTFATTANQDNSSYGDRISKFTISDIDAATNASTSGVTVNSNESVAFSTGDNIDEGYVARWTGIQPGSDGTFVVRVDEQTAGSEGYGPSVFMLAEEASSGSTITFTGSELLGKPTNTSITINIIPDSDIEYYYEYGVVSGTYIGQTVEFSAVGGQPHEAVIDGLAGNTQYFYRMQYHQTGETGWISRDEHSFWTQRASGSTFTFSVTSDSHVNIMLGSASTWTSTLNNVVDDQSDFLIDLGDTFAMDNVTTEPGAENAYKYQRQFFDIVGGSMGVYLAMGNHEQIEGWHLDDLGSNPANSQPAFSTNAMKKFYVNPVPDGFYTGDEQTFSYIDGDHLLEDYYAWTWGDALFVVIDPFWYTTTKPFFGTTGGGEGTDTGSGDRWDWTLGYDQYVWLKEVLENCDAAYKFIFAHHMVGGSDDYVRGGANPAHLVEWGGYNEAGTVYEWESKRPTWEPEPIHQIFVENGVSAFFHGHDHQYAYEERDGVVYQSLPAAGFSGNGFSIYSTGSGYTIQALPSPGHLRVTVSPSSTTVDYIATSGASVNYSYAIEPNEVPEGILGDVDGDGKVTSTDALIVLSGDVGFDITEYCPISCGDVNDDGLVNSTDAGIILTFNVGLSVPYALGTAGCPISEPSCAGCEP